MGVLVFVAALLLTVFAKAWPSFAHNGYIKWFFPGGDVDQQLRAIFNSPHDPAHYQYHLRAWPLLWDTILTTGVAVVFGLALSLLSAIFIVEFAPAPPEARSGPRCTPAGRRAVRDLRPDRNPRCWRRGSTNT